MTTLTLTREQALDALHETYGIAATDALPLGSELASIYRVDTPSSHLVVKIQQSDQHTMPLQRWRSDVVRGLDELGHPVPSLLPARDGHYIAFTTVGGHRVAVQVMEWVTATPYGTATVPPDFGEKLARAAARMQVDLQRMPAPPSTISHTWDARTMVTELTQHRDSSGSSRINDIATTALALHERHIAPYEHELPLTLVHQDLHDSNVLISATGEVAAILDFDDMLVGWRVAEPAVMAAYLARAMGDPVAALAGVTRGWTSALPFTDAEKQVLAPLAAMRLALNAVVWESRSTGEREEYARARSGGSIEAFHALTASLPTG